MEEEFVGVKVPRMVVRSKKTTPLVTHTVTAEVVDPKLVDQSAKTHLLARSEDWSWEQLRDYVVSKIVEIHGPMPRDGKKERAVFTSFMSRWGADSSRIAKFAMENKGGFWKGSPVSVNRFCKGSDPYFAQPISKILN